MGVVVFMEKVVKKQAIAFLIETISHQLRAKHCYCYATAVIQVVA